LANISDTTAQNMGYLNKTSTHENTHQPNYKTSSIKLPDNFMFMVLCILVILVL